jgi:hypothetical protein
MSLCPYCGEKAGWLQSSHPACVAKANSTAETVKTFVIKTIVDGGSLADLQLGLPPIMANVREQYVHEAILNGLNEGASQVAKRAPVSDDDYTRVEATMKAYGVNTDISKRWFGLLDLSQSNMLHQVLNNSLPVWGDPPIFNLHHDEVLCYQTGLAVVYAEEKTVSTGRAYGGFSVPVGGGIYAHLGESKPQKVSGLLPLDCGQVAITSENFYFAGQSTTLQIPLRHVIRYQPYVDGIGICESHGAPKVFTFNQDCEFPDGRSFTAKARYDVGWFLYPFLTALTNRLNA